ncbi:MAG TPA: NADH-quinone oxidoreductase subunit L, partial [Nitrospiria bacterium]|nr:NADH-quinone oxidoreductase subunit L [Nitrospiria bacterium]
SGGAGILFWVIGAATAFLTAFYSFRLIYTIFHGTSKVDPDLLSGKKGHGVHESPSVMTLPLILLAFLSVTVGWTGLPIHGWNGVNAVLSPMFPLDAHHEASGALQIILMLVSVAVAVGGWMTARYFYVVRPELPAQFAERAKGFYQGSLNKWYVDELYDRVFVQPTTRAAAWLWKVVDVRMVDGAVNGIGQTILASARGLRLVQTGQLQHYALVMVVGTFVILTVYLLFV